MTRTFQSKPESHRLIAHPRQRRGEVLAVAGYSQVFNSNPRLDSAQTLILDDAHAGEDAVASNWSIVAARPTPLYDALLAAVRTALDPQVLDRVTDDLLDPARRGIVELVPPEAVLAAASDVGDTLSAHAGGANRYARTSIGCPPLLPDVRVVGRDRTAADDLPDR